MKILSRILICAIFSLSFNLNAKTTSAYDLKFNGVDKEIETYIRSTLTLEEPLPPTHEFAQTAKLEITQALQPFGYYTPEVKVSAYNKDNLIHADIQIQLGAPVLIETIEFHLNGPGEVDPKLFRLADSLTLNKGQIFNHEQYEQNKKAILSKVIQEGYLLAAFSEHRVEVNIDNRSAQIHLTLSTGPRHYFGDVSFNDTVLSHELLKRYLPFKTGEVYSPEKILILQSRLNQSNYFSQVNVKALTESEGTLVPVQVELTDAKPNQYIIGAGYGTDTGARGKLGWTRRRLNSYGHRLNANAQISEIYHKLNVDYIIPGPHPDTDLFKINGGFYEDEYSEKPSQVYETGIIEEREINGWQRRISLFYHHERFNAYITNQGLESSLILPSITFIHTVRNNPLTPTHGRRFEITLRGSIDALFSDTTFFQTYAQYRWLHSLNGDAKVLFRTELGFTIPDDSVRLPLSQRFFAGGDLSLRGYGYRSLPSEIDKDGNYLPVGGAYLGIASLELSKTIKKPFGIFTFIDAGNAFRELFDEVEVGTGVGIEWQTKIGPIKIALAKPLTKTADSWRVHALFGPEI